MSKLESIVVALVIGIACPLLTFTAFWWMAATFHLCGFRLPTNIIIASALSGLGLGCLLDVICLRRWVHEFYTASWWRMLAVFLSLFVVAFGFFMGFPIGTFLLGIVAGAYVGRREYHSNADEGQLATTLNKVAVLTSLLTAGAALPIGILGLKEPIVAAGFEAYFGRGTGWAAGPSGVLLVGLFCVFLAVVQHWCVRVAGRVAFRIGGQRGVLQRHSDYLPRRT